MKVGDLVEVTTLHGRCKNGRIGVILKCLTDWKPYRYYVLLSGKDRAWPFTDSQLELVSESQNENGNSK
tara:strand:- start:223 stop:429 length:207 start_codon:yes stop_codon:yes gene_type:complete